MNCKKIVFTLGNINSFGNFNSLKNEKEALDIRTSNTDISLHNLRLFQEHRKSGKHQNLLQKTKQLDITKKKSKFIHKVLNPKQKQENKKKQQQSVVYRYFRRRIILQVNLLRLNLFFRDFLYQNIFLTIQNPYKILKSQKDTIRILDWLMEASTSLYLSRDSFFLAICIARKILKLNFLRKAHQKKLQIFIAAGLSIAAKFDHGSINYPEAINKITDHRIDKDNIIQAEIIIIKKLKFELPLKSMIFNQIVDVCSRWHQFVISKAEFIKIDIRNLYFGESEKIIFWQNSSQKIFLQLCHLFNGIIIHFEEFQIEKGKVLKPLTFTLFTILNARTNQFFPLSPDDRSHLILLFQDFLIQIYNFTNEDVRKWMSELIKLRSNLNIVEFAQKFINQVFIRQQMSEDSEITEKKDFFYRQAYRSVLEWT